MLRSNAPEWMDDLSIQDERLFHALDELRWVNRLLGGYGGTMAFLAPYLKKRGQQETIHILDVGAGLADLPEYVVLWCHARNINVEICALDLNPATISYAGRTLDERLPLELRSKIRLEEGNALSMPFPDGRFHVATASLFLHHFDEPDQRTLLQELNRVTRDGCIVNDLHRHPFAYYGIRALASITGASPMFSHDAPLSVERGFTRTELANLARTVGVSSFRLTWFWAFRWVLATGAVSRTG